MLNKIIPFNWRLYVEYLSISLLKKACNCSFGAMILLCALLIACSPSDVNVTMNHSAEGEVPATSGTNNTEPATQELKFSIDYAIQAGIFLNGVTTDTIDSSVSDARALALEQFYAQLVVLNDEADQLVGEQLQLYSAALINELSSGANGLTHAEKKMIVQDIVAFQTMLQSNIKVIAQYNACIANYAGDVADVATLKNEVLTRVANGAVQLSRYLTYDMLVTNLIDQRYADVGEQWTDKPNLDAMLTDISKPYNAYRAQLQLVDDIYKHISSFDYYIAPSYYQQARDASATISDKATRQDIQTLIDQLLGAPAPNYLVDLPQQGGANYLVDLFSVSASYIRQPASDMEIQNFAVILEYIKELKKGNPDIKLVELILMLNKKVDDKALKMINVKEAAEDFEAAITDQTDLPETTIVKAQTIERVVPPTYQSTIDYIKKATFFGDVTGGVDRGFGALISTAVSHLNSSNMSVHYQEVERIEHIQRDILKEDKSALLDRIHQTSLEQAVAWVQEAMTSQPEYMDIDESFIFMELMMGEMGYYYDIDEERYIKRQLPSEAEKTFLSIADQAPVIEADLRKTSENSTFNVKNVASSYSGQGQLFNDNEQGSLRDIYAVEVIETGLVSVLMTPRSTAGATASTNLSLYGVNQSGEVFMPRSAMAHLPRNENGSTGESLSFYAYPGTYYLVCYGSSKSKKEKESLPLGYAIRIAQEYERQTVRGVSQIVYQDNAVDLGVADIVAGVDIRRSLGLRQFSDGTKFAKTHYKDSFVFNTTVAGALSISAKNHTTPHIDKFISEMSEFMTSDVDRSLIITIKLNNSLTVAEFELNPGEQQSERIELKADKTYYVSIQSVDTSVPKYYALQLKHQWWQVYFEMLTTIGATLL